MLRDEEMKIRVPAAVKGAFQALAAAEMTSESEIARRALHDYLARRGFTAEVLRVFPVGEPVNVEALTEAIGGMLFADAPNSDSKDLMEVKKRIVAAAQISYGKKRHKSSK